MVSNAIIITGAALILVGLLGRIFSKRGEGAPADAEVEEEA
jgi:hypothetical protein